MQSHFPLGFNDNIYHDGIFLKCEILLFFSVLECNYEKRKSRSHGNCKNGNPKRKMCTETTLKYFSKGSFFSFK